MKRMGIEEKELSLELGSEMESNRDKAMKDKGGEAKTEVEQEKEIEVAEGMEVEMETEKEKGKEMELAEVVKGEKGTEEKGDGDVEMEE